MSHAIQRSEIYHADGYIRRRQVVVHVVLICRSDRLVHVAVLVGVVMVDIRRPEIDVGVVMLTLGKVVVHHRSEGRCEQCPKSQYSGPGPYKSPLDPCCF